MLIDTHAHMQMIDFADDFSVMIDRCQTEKMAVINIGTSYADFDKVIELSNKYDWCYASLGIHPTDVFDNFFDETIFLKYLNDKVVAIGEVGLDLWHLDSIKTKFALTDKQILDKQIEAFVKQIEFARQHDLAVVIHGRNGVEPKFDVYQMIFNLLQENKNQRVVFHCYGGDYLMAKKIVDVGYFLGFDGPITFKKNIELRDMIKKLPITNILAETDCPFLAPEPVRGQRNEPIFVKHIISKIAEIKNIPVIETEDILWNNAKNLFKL